MKIKEGGGVSKEHEDNRTKNYEKPRYRIIRIVYAPFNFTRYIPESTFIKESSKVRRPFRLHLASPLINASGWPLETG